MVTSLLDTDMYKWTMLYYLYGTPFRNMKTNFSLMNRGSENILKYVDIHELRQELDATKRLVLCGNEIEYIQKILFEHIVDVDESFFDFITEYSLPDYIMYEDNGELNLSFEGPWTKVSLWETIAMSTICELYYKNIGFDGSDSLQKGISKINKLQANKVPLDTIIEYGTRRRASKAIQHDIMWAMAGELKTSNLLLAKELDITPMDTMAHEIFMGIEAATRDQANENNIVSAILSDWKDIFKESLHIALIDTYTTEAYLESIKLEPAILCDYRGMRQDSGDPEAIADMYIAFLKEYNVDPKDKVVLFSDALDEDKIADLYHKYKNVTNPKFGWGTDFTCDIDVPNLNIVVKMTECNGVSTKKISDSPGKTMGV